MATKYRYLHTCGNVNGEICTKCAAIKDITYWFDSQLHSNILTPSSLPTGAPCPPGHCITTTQLYTLWHHAYPGTTIPPRTFSTIMQEELHYLTSRASGAIRYTSPPILPSPLLFEPDQPLHNSRQSSPQRPRAKRRSPRGPKDNPTSLYCSPTVRHKALGMILDGFPMEEILPAISQLRAKENGWLTAFPTMPPPPISISAVRKWAIEEGVPLPETRRSAAVRKAWETRRDRAQFTLQDHRVLENWTAHEADRNASYWGASQHPSVIPPTAPPARKPASLTTPPDPDGFYTKGGKMFCKHDLPVHVCTPCVGKLSSRVLKGDIPGKKKKKK